MKIKGFSIVLVLLFTLFLSGCRGCSRSGRESLRDSGSYHNEEIKKSDQSPITEPRERSSAEPARRTNTQPNQTAPGNIVKMRNDGGVYYIPLMVNGIEMEFIFDTGASIISISTAEALFMQRQGKLHDSDILGTSYFSDATGTISEGTSINLREVQIGSRTLHNVRASVVHNLEAPLLLGQSALNQFGRITIDYNQNILILE